MGKIGIVTPSYNKPNYVLRAIDSIVQQSYKDWEYHIVDNSTDSGITRNVIREYLSRLPNDIRDKINYKEEDFTKEFKKNNYVPSVITNKIFKEIIVDYLFYISDDDYIEYNCFDVLVEWFSRNLDKKIVYFKLSLLQESYSKTTVIGELPVLNTFGKVFGKNLQTPLNYMDGGQIMFKKEILKDILYPFFPETSNPFDACHCDGLFLLKLCDKYYIHPVDYPLPLGSHNMTELSTWRKR